MVDENKDKWHIPEESHEEESNEMNENPLTVQEIITERFSKNLVVFSGPREVGKTVALIRLAFYLRNKREIKIEPNKSFRHDEAYKAAVEAFEKDLNQPNFSPNRTGSINFLVLDIFKNANLYCQFLEAPGEAFYDSLNPSKRTFPAYITRALNDQKLNRVFVFFFEDRMLQGQHPMAYSKRLASLVGKMNKKKDDVVIIYNKADRKSSYFDGDQPNVKEFKRHLYEDQNYSEFFGALTRHGVPVKFLPFSSGDFEKIPGKNEERWIHSNDFYPEALWRAIDKCFKSFSWFG